MANEQTEGEAELGSDNTVGKGGVWWLAALKWVSLMFPCVFLNFSVIVGKRFPIKGLTLFIKSDISWSANAWLYYTK